MPNEPAGAPGNRGSTIADLAGAAGPGSVDSRHLLLVGAGPGLGTAVARRFAASGYRVTLVARSPDRLRDLAGTLAGTGAEISTIAADVGDPDGLGTRMRELYGAAGAPGVIVYNAVMGAPDRLRDHAGHRGRVRRPPDPGPGHRFAGQGAAAVGRDDARR